MPCAAYANWVQSGGAMPAITTRAESWGFHSLEVRHGPALRRPAGHQQRSALTIPGHGEDVQSNIRRGLQHPAVVAENDVGLKADSRHQMQRVH
jgi:hypothetical protein